MKILATTTYTEISGHYIGHASVNIENTLRREPNLMLLIISHRTILPSADILHLSIAKLYVHIQHYCTLVVTPLTACFATYTAHSYIMLTTTVVA